MDQSLSATPAQGFPELPAERVTEVESAAVRQTILASLDDANSRAILEATSRRSLSAKEIAETCKLPLSTTYRKLEMLVEASFLEERTRLSQSGKHPSEYVRLVEDVLVSVTPTGELRIQVYERDVHTDQTS